MKHMLKKLLTRLYLLKYRIKWLRGIGRAGGIFIGGAESLPQPLSPGGGAAAHGALRRPGGQPYLH